MSSAFTSVNPLASTTISRAWSSFSAAVWSSSIAPTTCRVSRGVAVPIPSRLFVSSQKRFELSSVRIVPFEKITDPAVNEVTPVPPPPTDAVPKAGSAEAPADTRGIPVPESGPTLVIVVVPAPTRTA